MNITSLNNDKVKYWSKLKQKKYRDLEKKFLVEDEHLVNLALEKNLVLELICVNDIYNFSNTYVVSDSIMKKLSMQVSSTNVIAVCRMNDEFKLSSKVLLLDAIQDPGNLGTIIRSAVAFDFKTIILGNGCVDIYNDKVIRSSEGMIFNISFKKSDLRDYISELKKNDYKIIGTDVRSGTNIEKYNKVGLVLGNEGAGVSSDVLDMCDEYVHIPMNKDCESLNVGVAASILMYEVYHG